MAETLKPKKCRICKESFQPFRPLQVCCGHVCAIEKAQKDRAKKEMKSAASERREIREAKQKAKSRSEWMKEAQAAFNAWIRYRDSGQPCISCGRHHTGQYHAGHYRTVGANPELRFEENNVHLQCAPCNNHLHGNLINYRIGLIKKIGLELVEWLEGDHQPKKYSIDDLREIKDRYKKLLKERITCLNSTY